MSMEYGGNSQTLPGRSDGISVDSNLLAVSITAAPEGGLEFSPNGPRGRVRYRAVHEALSSKSDSHHRAIFFKAGRF